MPRTFGTLGLALSFALASPALAHGDNPAGTPPHGPVMSADQMYKAFGWDFDKAEIRTEKLADGFHVLFGLGGNIAVSVGEDGTLIVDDQFPQLMPNSRDKMLHDNIVNFGTFATEQKAYPQHALSDITYDTTMQFHINDQKIELLHVGPAHTAGDTAVIFRGVNAVHMGDVFNNSGSSTPTMAAILPG